MKKAGKRRVLASVFTNDVVLLKVAELRTTGDASFGANSPFRLFRRNANWGVLSGWIILVLTSLPIHLLLNGVFSYTRNIIPWSGAAILSNETSLYITGPQLDWINVSCNACIQALSPSFNVQVRNFSAVDAGSGYVLEELMYGDFPSPPTWNFTPGSAIDNLITGDPRSQYLFYCLIDFIEPQCGISLRWIPSMIVTFTLALKAVVTMTVIRHSKKIRIRLYNTIGDVISLAARYPKGELLQMVSKNKYEVICNVKASRRRFHVLGDFGLPDCFIYVYFLGGMGTIISLVFEQGGFESLSALWSPLQWLNLSSSELVLAILIANSLQLWVSGAWLFVNNHVTRMWQEWEWHRYYQNVRIPQPYGPENVRESCGKCA